jgi:hypothetical protein
MENGAKHSNLKAGVTVCTVHHKTPDLLEVQLGRMRRHGWPTRVLVIDNASGPVVCKQNEEIARRFGAELFLSQKVVSHGVAIDLAAREVNTRWLLALDSDAWPIRDGWLSAIIDAHASAVVRGPVHTYQAARQVKRWAHPWCLLVDVPWLRRSGARFADAWPAYDTGAQLTKLADEQGEPVAFLSQRGAAPWHGTIVLDAVYHSWYSTRLRTTSHDQLRKMDGINPRRMAASMARLLAAERAFAATDKNDPFEPKNATGRFRGISLASLRNFFRS